MDIEYYDKNMLLLYGDAVDDKDRKKKVKWVIKAKKTTNPTIMDKADEIIEDIIQNQFMASKFYAFNWTQANNVKCPKETYLQLLDVAEQCVLLDKEPTVIFYPDFLEDERNYWHVEHLKGLQQPAGPGYCDALAKYIESNDPSVKKCLYVCWKVGVQQVDLLYIFQ